MADSYQQQTLIKICVRHHATHTGADFKQPVLFVRAFVFLSYNFGRSFLFCYVADFKLKKNKK